MEEEGEGVVVHVAYEHAVAAAVIPLGEVFVEVEDGGLWRGFRFLVVRFPTRGGFWWRDAFGVGLEEFVEFGGEPGAWVVVVQVFGDVVCGELGEAKAATVLAFLEACREEEIAYFAEHFVEECWAGSGVGDVGVWVDFGQICGRGFRFSVFSFKTCILRQIIYVVSGRCFGAAGIGDGFVVVWVGGLVVGWEVSFEVVGSHGDHFEDVLPVFAGEAARYALEERRRTVPIIQVGMGLRFSVVRVRIRKV